MKVLIGRVASQENQDQSNSADNSKKSEGNKTENNKVDTVSHFTESNQAEQQNKNVQECQNSKKYGQLTLTAFHEKQMREILKEMEENIGGASSVR